MRTQAERDEQTMAIAGALGRGVVFLVAASGVLWLATAAAGLPDAHGGPAFAILTVLAALVAVVHLVRARRR